MILYKEKFICYHSKEFKKRKDEQTINDVIEDNEKGLANSKFTRTYIMDKEFYNLNLILSDI